MAKRTRRKFSAQFKIDTVAEVLKAEKTAAQIGRELDISPSLLSRWKHQYLKHGPASFHGRRSSQHHDSADQLETLVAAALKLLNATQASLVDIPEILETTQESAKDIAGLEESDTELLGDKGQEVRFDESVVGLTFAPGEKNHVPDSDREALHCLYEQWLPDTKSDLAIPLYVGDEIIGVLYLESAGKPKISKGNAEYLHEMATALLKNPHSLREKGLAVLLAPSYGDQAIGKSKRPDSPNPVVDAFGALVLLHYMSQAGDDDEDADKMKRGKAVTKLLQGLHREPGLVRLEEILSRFTEDDHE